MQEQHDVFGEVIKAARIRTGLTVEKLAERLDLSVRYIYRLEDEGKRPSFDILCRLIRELNIDPNLIFWPEKQVQDDGMDELVHMLHRCDGRSMAVIRATVKAALESQ